jgi:para-nitrobenzyl esterase
MKTKLHFVLFTLFFLLVSTAQAANGLRVKVAGGVIEGFNDSGLRVFKGVPFAAPPVGELRWKEPQPVKEWAGIKETKKFGPRAMQLPVFGDMDFRSNGMSEDCLYLNIWTPAKTTGGELPVLVYYYGGGFIAGDGSEPRYDGESMARRGIVAVTVNYRLGVFGFMAHPGLTKESGHQASGNYGLLDQAAALKWVKENIAAFGGDPNHITIAGESAGSISVSLLMASPLTRNLIAGAIGESGSAMGTLFSPASLAEGEKAGLKFQEAAGAKSLLELRKMQPEELLKVKFGGFPLLVDGYFLPEKAEKIYKAGQQAKVPFLVGWNSQEMSAPYLMGKEPLTVESFTAVVKKLYGTHADEVLRLYHPTSDADVERVAMELAGDRFLAFSTWKWANLQAETGIKPVYRYFYARPRPEMRPEMGNASAGLAGGVVKDGAAQKAPPATGAVHSAEIEYALGNLSSNRVYDWKADDYKVSTIMQGYFANFIKTFNPNSFGLPQWMPVVKGTDASVMHIDVDTRLETEKYRQRYLLLDGLLK